MKSLVNSADKDELLRRIASLQPTSQRLWGKMSAHQMVCHLTDGYRLYMDEIKSEPVPSPAFIKALMRTLALYLPVAWPEGKVQTLPSIDQVAGGGTPPAEFSRDVDGLREIVERFTQIPRSYQWEHPGLGPLSYWQVMRLGYLHADHHLRQFGT